MTIEMIVVIVADENPVDLRQVFDGDSKWALPFESAQGKRRAVRSDDWVGQIISAPDLQKKCRVSKPGRDNRAERGRVDRIQIRGDDIDGDGPGGAVLRATRLLRTEAEFPAGDGQQPGNVVPADILKAPANFARLPWKRGLRHFSRHHKGALVSLRRVLARQDKGKPVAHLYFRSHGHKGLSNLREAVFQRIHRRLS